jgi:flagellar basal-body rod protein FlgB
MQAALQSPSLVKAMNHRMNYLVDRQGIITGNIANASTPGYIARDLSFKKLVDFKPGLKIDRTNPRHLTAQGSGSATGEVEMDYTHIRHDGNSVKLDEQILKMNEVQLGFTTVTRLYQKQKELQLNVVRTR